MTPGFESFADPPEQLALQQPENESRYKHIVVPTSLSATDRPAMQLGLEMARMHRAQLSVLHVLPAGDHENSLHWLDAIYRLHESLSGQSPTVTDREQSAALVRRRIESFFDREFPEFQYGSAAVQFEFRTGEVADGIARFVNDTGADAVVMSSRHSRWWRPLLPSRVRRVLQLTHQQVILVRPDAGKNSGALSESA